VGGGKVYKVMVLESKGHGVREKGHDVRETVMKLEGTCHGGRM
jgi:hypothetical protein